MNDQKKKEAIEADIEERGPLADRILFWLLKHPYQRTSNLAFVFQVDVSTIRRHIHTLIQQALVETITPVNTITRRYPDVLYYLSPRGIERVADLVGGTNAAGLAKLWKVSEIDLLRLLPRLPNYLLLQEMVLRLIADAPRQFAYPGGYPAAIRWHWQHDYVHLFERKKKRMTCRADGVIVVRCRPLTTKTQEYESEIWYCVLVVVDPGWQGSEDLHLMRERLEQVLHWRESSERWLVYHTFLPLLVIAPTAHQRDLWIYSALEAAAHLRIAPLKGACAVLGDDAPWRSSWYGLDGTGNISLQSVLEPLVPQAIPPGLLAPRQIEATASKKGRQKECKVMIGNFQERAKHLRTSGAELKSLARVSLFSTCLPRHSLDLAVQIYAVPLIAPQELAALLRRENDTMQRYLFDLHQFQVLETVETACGKRLLLTETGLRLIAAMQGVPLLHIAERDGSTHRWRQRGIRHLQRMMEHTAGIYTFLARLQRQANKIDQELLWWETMRSFRRYHTQGTWHNLMPDALFAYQAKETRVEAWLEWDTGSMHLKPMTVKFEAYAQYIRSQQYRQEHRTAPTLLLVTPQNGREQSLRAVMASVFGMLPLTVWTTTEPLLQMEGPLATVWKPLRPGREGEEEHGHRSTWM